MPVSCMSRQLPKSLSLIVLWWLCYKRVEHEGGGITQAIPVALNYSHGWLHVNSCQSVFEPCHSNYTNSRT